MTIGEFTVNFSKKECDIISRALDKLPQEDFKDLAPKILKRLEATFSREELSCILVALKTLLDTPSAYDEEVTQLLKKMTKINQSFLMSKWDYKLNNEPTAIAFSSDSKILCVGDQQGSIYTFDLETGQLLMQNDEIKGAILALHLQDSFLFIFDNSGLLSKWTFAKMEKLCEFQCSKSKHERFSHALFKTDDLALVVVLSNDGYFMRDSKIFELDLHDLATINYKLHGPELPYADADNRIDALTLSKDGRSYAVTHCTSVGTMDGDWAFCCPEYISIFGDHPIEYRYEEGYSPPKHKKNVATFSPEGKQILVTSSYMGCFFLLNASETSQGEKREIMDLGYDFKEAWIRSLDWARSGNVFAAGNSDGTLMFWDSLTYQELWSKKAFEASIEHLMFSPDSKYCVVLSKKGEIAVLS